MSKFCLNVCHLIVRYTDDGRAVRAHHSMQVLIQNVGIVRKCEGVDGVVLSPVLWRLEFRSEPEFSDVLV